jgi:hypothetical protein
MDDRFKAFIAYKSNLPKEDLIEKYLFTVTLFAVPTAVFGVGRIISSIIIIPTLIMIFVWSFLLLKKQTKARYFYLYMGVYSIYISFVLIVAVFKLVNTVLLMPLIVLIGTLIVDIAIIIFNIMIVDKIVKAGFYTRAFLKTQITCII